MDSRTLSLAVLLALAAPALHAAEVMYKSTMPDGRIIYGESPQPGAKRVGKVAAPPERSGVVVATPEDLGRAERITGPSGAVVTVIPAPVRQSPKMQGPGSSANSAGVLPQRGY